MINGSPNQNGCTYTALSEVRGQLEKHGVEVEMIQIGKAPVQDCIACGFCWNGEGRCVFDNDQVNRVSKLLAESDGLIVGSPVYYAGPSGAIRSFLDRMFFSSSQNFAHKPAACVVSCRRGGGETAFESLNKFFSLAKMPVVSSQYWNVVHGHTPAEVKQDLEGMQIMRTLGDNMAWMLKSIEKAKLAPPEQEERVGTNFIR
jgi:multimeric flavodoxin WrbA